MSVEYKQKSNLPDLYNILGLSIDVCNEKNCNEIIQKAYIKKAKVCHPDKHPGRKDVEEIFELITGAYDILKNEKERKAYNHKLTLENQSSNDFNKLKKGAMDYAESFGEYKPPTDTQKISFKEQMKLLDNKHNFNSSLTDAYLTPQESKKKINDLTKIRTDQDNAYKHEKLFEGHFDRNKFNAAFDKFHKKNESNGMILHNGVPSAWNDIGTDAGFSNFDNLDNLYVETDNRFDTSRQNYGGIDFGEPTNVKISDLQDLQKADYVDNHNVLGEDYYKNLKEKLRDRKNDASLFDKMKYNDFKRDETAGYGIFDQLGYKINDRLAIDVDEESLSQKYEKLMSERNQDLLNGGSNHNNGASKKSSVRGIR